MYFRLAAKVADDIEFLIDAQQEGENAFIADNEEPLAFGCTRKAENTKTLEVDTQISRLIVLHLYTRRYNES